MTAGSSAGERSGNGEHIEEFDESSRWEVEEEIQRHSRAIRMLQARLNASAPISKLPPELLSEIFIHVASDRAQVHERAPLYHPYWTWISVLQVCTHWRAVAIASPRLWSRIVVTMHPEWMKEVLQRSRSAPLFVSAHTDSRPGGRKSQSLKVVMESLARIRDLRLTGAPDILERALSVWRGPAPLLENVSLTVPTDLGLSRQFSPRLDLFLNGQAERLQRLEMQEYPFPWNIVSSFPLLKHLIVSHQLDDAVPTMTDMLNTLERLPLLEELELRDILPPCLEATNYLPGVTRVIALPRLRSVKLSARTQDCTNLLIHLSVHPDAVFSIHCRGREGAELLAATLYAKHTVMKGETNFTQLQGVRSEGIIVSSKILSIVAVSVFLSSAEYSWENLCA